MTEASSAISPPTISVVIPHLNQPEGLARCLTSLRNQGYPAEAFEVIVVDNGSEPLPEAVVAEFPGVSLLEEPTPGPGPARNRGVAAAKGEILAFTDADCIADENWLKVIAEEMERDADAGEGKGPILGGKVEIALKDPAKPTSIEAYEMVFSYRQKLYIEKKGFSGTGNLAVRAQDFAVIGRFGGIEIAEDSDWGARAGRLGYRIRYLPQMIVKHPAREDLTELRSKWSRQIHHDFAMHQQGDGGRARWCLRALLVGLSPFVLDIWRTLGQPGPAKFGARLGACGLLITIRTWRMARMLRLARAEGPTEDTLQWNRCSRS